MEMGNLTLPTKVHTGVLYVSKKPIYIVEIVEENGNPGEYVTVYEAHRPRDVKKDEVIVPVKAYDNVERDLNKVRNTTVLGDIASKIVKPNKKRYKVTKPPLFMEDITVGKDTFTGKEGLGFYEREKDDIKISQKTGITVKRGKRTGVFVSLDSIIWEKLRVPTNDIVQEYKARKTLYSL